jgi:hypothetical protein
LREDARDSSPAAAIAESLASSRESCAALLERLVKWLGALERTVYLLFGVEE